MSRGNGGNLKYQGRRSPFIQPAGISPPFIPQFPASFEERTQKQPSFELVRVEAIVKFEPGAFAEMSFEDVSIVANSCENSALPILFQPQLCGCDRHPPCASCIPTRFRPLCTEVGNKYFFQGESA